MPGQFSQLIQALTILDRYEVMDLSAGMVEGEIEVELMEDIKHSDALVLKELGWKNWGRRWRQTEREFGLIEGMFDTRPNQPTGILPP